MIGASWPLVLILVTAAGMVGNELVQDHMKNDHFPRETRAAVVAGLHRTLPPILVLTFLVQPSISTKIFKAYLCDPFKYDRDEVRWYVHDALDVRCDSDEYQEVKRTANIFLGIWPVGCPIMYALFLWANRREIRSGMQTKLSRATAFLYGDYSTGAFWWEPVDLCRKAALYTIRDQT